MYSTDIILCNCLSRMEWSVVSLLNSHPFSYFYFMCNLIFKTLFRCTDLDATREAIVLASKLPLSIIIVGVGSEGNFNRSDQILT